MDASKIYIQKQIQAVLVAARGLSALPRTTIDPVSLEILGDLEGDGELLTLAYQWLTDSKAPSTLGKSDDAKIAWPRIRVWMPHFEKLLNAME
mgnify:CR=1 FL=1